MTEESDPIPLDVNQMRDDVIEAYGFQRVNEPHTFYYDESNNIRRLHLKAVGLNVPEPQIYVLGGIAHLGPAKDLGFKALRDSLRLQPSVKEMKFEHVAKGDFLTVLTSRKLTVFLEWVLRANLVVHYIAMDPMYWATVDIIESASAESPAIFAFGPQLKSDLYRVLRLDMPQLIAMLVRYGYPDVGPSGPEFMRELLEILECREDHLDHFNYYILKGVLQMGARSNQLPFLENETPNQSSHSLPS